MHTNHLTSAMYVIGTRRKGVGCAEKVFLKARACLYRVKRTKE